MRKFFKGFGIAFLAFVALIAAMAFLGRGQTEKVTIQNVAMQQVPDGTYSGTYNAYRFTNIVEVTVENHFITNIDIVKTQREDISVELANDVITEQTLAVDTVSGATLDKNAFLKAVENALTEAIEK